MCVCVCVRKPIFGVGAFLGALLVWASTGTGGLSEPANLGSKADIPGTHLNESYNVGNAYILEVVCCLLIGYVYHVVMVDRRDQFAPIGPLVVGVTHFVTAFPATALTGGHFNPARTFALAAISGEADEIFLFVTAPFIGVALAVLAYNYLFSAVVAPKAGAATTVVSDYESYESSSSSYFSEFY